MKRYIRSASGNGPRTFAIWRCGGYVYLDDIHEYDVMDTTMDIEGPFEKSKDYKRLLRILKSKYKSEIFPKRSGLNNSCYADVYIIAPYYKDGHPGYDTEYGNYVATLNFDGTISEEFPDGDFDESYFDDEGYVTSASDLTAAEAAGYQKKQVDEVRNFAEHNFDDPESDIGFEYNGQWITNPFVDPSGRFPLSYSEAIRKYGRVNIDNFIRDALKEIYGD